MNPIVYKLVKEQRVDTLHTLANEALLGLRQVLKEMPYEDYLATEHWEYMRNLALDRAKGRCQLCNSRHRLQVHHRTYEGRGTERLEDLTVLCKDCHSAFHRRRPDAVGAEVSTKVST